MIDLQSVADQLTAWLDTAKIGEDFHKKEPTLWKVKMV